MSYFEYLSVMVSIVLGLALADVLRDLARMYSRGRDLKWDPLTTTWFIYLILVIVLGWWAHWDFRSEDIQWTQLEFIFVLCGPALLVLLAHVAMPNEPLTVTDLRAHWDSISHRVFTLLIWHALWSITLQPLVLGRLSPNFWPQVLYLAAAVTGRLWNRRSVHMAVAVVIGVVILAAILVTRATPT